MKQCNICDSKHYGNGLCYKHWRRSKSKSPRPTFGMSPDERFDYYTSKTPDANGCLVYTGSLRCGYGQFYFQGKNHVASRWAWIRSNGPISDALAVCHTCDNPACVNLEHLFVATNQENTLDKVEKSR